MLTAQPGRGVARRRRKKKMTWDVGMEVHGEGPAVAEWACGMLAGSDGEGGKTKAVDMACRWRAHWEQQQRRPAHLPEPMDSCVLSVAFFRSTFLPLETTALSSHSWHAFCSWCE
jgi:hypothetical protein